MCDLDVFGSYKLKEFVSDASYFIDKRMDNHKFFQWVENLKERKYV